MSFGIPNRRHTIVSASLMMVDAIVSAVAILLILIVLLKTGDQAIARIPQADLIYRCEADGKTLVSLMGDEPAPMPITNLADHLGKVADPSRVAIYVRLETTMDTFVQCGLRARENIRRMNVKRDAQGAAIFLLDIAYQPLGLEEANE